jgi:hypothetical protein
VRHDQARASRRCVAFARIFSSLPVALVKQRLSA